MKVFIYNNRNIREMNKSFRLFTPDLHAVSEMYVPVQRAIQRASQVWREYTKRLIPFPYNRISVNKHKTLVKQNNNKKHFSIGFQFIFQLSLNKH